VGETPVTWVCDPVRGNTRPVPEYAVSGSICEEIRAFFEVHHAQGTVGGGIHLEVGPEGPALSPAEVLKCVMVALRDLRRRPLG
jgi:3-deoxy-D-arabino-heptulosonate 7-phosphate (DAHP) synthase class II